MLDSPLVGFGFRIFGTSTSVLDGTTCRFMDGMESVSILEAANSVGCRFGDGDMIVSFLNLVGWRRAG